MNQTSYGKITFFLLGFAALVGYFAFLSSLQFFKIRFGPESPNVYFFLQLPYSLASVLIAFALYPLQNRISIQNRIRISLSGITVVLILFPTLATIIGGLTGYWICNVLMLIFGALEYMAQGSILSFASIFEQQNFISIYFTGVGVGGVAIGCTKCICLWAFGKSAKGQKIGAISYFLIAAIIISISQFVSHHFFHTSFCKESIIKSKNPLIKLDVPNINIESEESEEVEDNIVQDEDKQQSLICQYSKKNPNQILKQILNANLKMLPYQVYMIILFIQTYMLYPGVSIQKVNLSELMTDEWKNALLVLSFCVFETIGQYSVNLVTINNIWTNSIILMFRFVFILIFLEILNSSEGDWIGAPWVIFVANALFGLTNGYLTSSLSIAGPKQVLSHEKELSGMVMTNSLLFGILTGGFLSLLFRNIHEQNYDHSKGQL